MWLIWRSSNDIGHINKVKLHQARIVLVTTFGGCAVMKLPYYVCHNRPVRWPTLTLPAVTMDLVSLFIEVTRQRQGEINVTVSTAARRQQASWHLSRILQRLYASPKQNVMPLVMIRGYNYS